MSFKGTGTWTRQVERQEEAVMFGPGQRPLGQAK